MAQFNSITTSASDFAPGYTVGAWLENAMVAQGWEFVETWQSGLATGITGSTSGSVASSTSTIMTRSGGSNWSASSLKGYELRIVGGTGSGQVRIISGNTTTTITVLTAFDVTPDNTSTFEIYSGAYHDVYRSPAAANSLIDFYVCVRRYYGFVHLALFEEWDSVNKTAKKYAPSSGAGLTVNPADNTVTDATGVLLNSATLRYLFVSVPSLAATTFVADVTPDRIILGSSTKSDAGVVYAGIFDSLLPAAIDPVPLVLWNFMGSNSSSPLTGPGSCTREPGTPAVGTYNFCVQVFNQSSGTPGSVSRLDYSGAANSASLSQSFSDVYRGSRAVAKIQFESSRAGSAMAGVRGVTRGVLASAYGSAFGDTLTVTMADNSTRTYVLAQMAFPAIVGVWIRTS